MTTALTQHIVTALAQFSSTTRLYAMTVGDGSIDLGPSGLLVEAFTADDAVNDIGLRNVIVLSTSVHVRLESLLGQPASLDISLADGTRTRFGGDISEVAMLGSDGGFARYRVCISSWLWRLAYARNNRVWQDKNVLDIVDAVFDSYKPIARWRWSDDTSAFMADARPRSYCCQYRESDLEFVRRLLAEEGLHWRFEDTGDGPCMMLFADSTRQCAVPEDATCGIDGGIRYHGVSAVERQDTVQALTEERRLHATLATVLSYDYKSRQVKAGSSPTQFRQNRNLPALEFCDAPGQYAYADRSQAQRYADLRMEESEARSRLWRGRSTVRTLRAGTRLTITGAPRFQPAESPAFTVLRVTSIGLNNLPPPAQHALSTLFGSIPALLQQSMRTDAPEDIALVIERAIKSGYANCFEAIPADLPWRQHQAASDDAPYPRPTAHGSQTAIVVGPDGSDTPNGTSELYCDRLGRVRIRFHWQESGNATCWVRVAQRAAGGGMGSQFLPRIGQEVLVQFLENDIDRPIIVGALYNGRGEGGIAPTPGSGDVAQSAVSYFEPAHDHARSAQGNLAGGNSPVWHGASGDQDGHRNPAAQWGVRSKEFGGFGYNQLLFDDTYARGRVQLKCTHAATELNLGHLIHAADNYRGSFRGMGAELRTDAYGAVRAVAGLLVSSYKISHSAVSRDLVGENTGGIAVLKTAANLVETLNAVTLNHQAVGLASHLGSIASGTSVLNARAAPLHALLKSMAESAGDDNIQSVQTASCGEGAPIHNVGQANLNDPIIAISAMNSFGANASQSFQLANGETITLISGEDSQFVIGRQMRTHTGQAIGILGGAFKSGKNRTGIQLITAKDAIELQAQSDVLKVQAKNEINVISANAHVDWAACKRISLMTAGGANIIIEDGNIAIQCPGKITVLAGKKSLKNPVGFSYPLPSLPTSICVECLIKARRASAPFVVRLE